MKKLKQKFQNNFGFSLVELVVAVGVFAILASGVFYVVTNSYTNFYGTGDKQAIAEFAQEGLEAVRSIRENSWQYIEDNVGSDLGVSQTAGLWSFSGSSDVSGGLTRVITIADVSRDTSGNIVSSGGSDDPLTKKITITVSGTGISDYVLTSYLTSWANRSWEQTDWSGGVGTHYWSYEDQAYSSSSIDGLSTPGELKLAYVPGVTTWGWGDLTDFASSSMTGNNYAALMDDDHDYYYNCGSDSGVRRYDISNIKTSGFGTQTYLATGHNCYASGLNSVNKHIYAAGGASVITSIEIGTFAVLDTYTPATYLGKPYAIAINEAGDHMYMGGASSKLFSLDIASNGTLTCTNCTLWCDTKIDPKCTPNMDDPQNFGASVINGLWLDDTNEKLYMVTDDANRAITRLDVSDPNNITEDYSLYYAYDMVDIKYIGLNSTGHPRFLVGLDYLSSGNEVMLIDDNPDSSTFTIVAGVDLSAYAGKAIYVRDLEYTNNNEAFVAAVDADGIPYVHLYALDDIAATDGVSPSIIYNATGPYGYYTLNYHPIAYSDKYGGIFAGWTYYDSSTRRVTFFEQEEVPGVGSYASSGNLVSSILDIGSSDQELHSLTVSQNIPSGCGIEITLEADDNSSFSSPTQQVISGTASSYATEINVALSNQRWLRYQVDMTPCNSGTETPSLYSLHLNYR
ncbi:type II secretion system protein [Candidatus Nomurabacteria bacterium]|nr:type II secretion system protein [Candidatus Nomurabacteria bacterium]